MSKAARRTFAALAAAVALAGCETGSGTGPRLAISAHDTVESPSACEPVSRLEMQCQDGIILQGASESDLRERDPANEEFFQETAEALSTLKQGAPTLYAKMVKNAGAKGLRIVYNPNLDPDKYLAAFDQNSSLGSGPYIASFTPNLVAHYGPREMAVILGEEAFIHPLQAKYGQLDTRSRNVDCQADLAMAVIDKKIGGTRLSRHFARQMWENCAGYRQFLDENRGKTGMPHPDDPPEALLDLEQDMRSFNLFYASRGWNPELKKDQGDRKFSLENSLLYACRAGLVENPKVNCKGIIPEYTSKR